jgi:hypothetical protein
VRGEYNKVYINTCLWLYTKLNPRTETKVQ